MFRAVGTGIRTTSLDPGGPGFKKAAITKPDPVCARTPFAQLAETVAERPGDVNLGRNLLNVAAEPGGPGRMALRRWPAGRQRHADHSRQDQDAITFRMTRHQRGGVGSGVDSGQPAARNPLVVDGARGSGQGLLVALTPFHPRLPAGPVVFERDEAGPGVRPAVKRIGFRVGWRDAAIEAQPFQLGLFQQRPSCQYLRVPYG